jgi:3-methylfumaryl-CoA hydratase
VPPGQKTTATVATQARTDHAWSQTTQLTNTLNFRYGGLTWNAHRIHYDGDYTRREEGYPAIVSNGGLSMHLMINAALSHGTGTLTGLTARLVHPLWVGDLIEVRGEAPKDGKLRIWAADKNGVLCGEMDLEFAS